MEELIRRIIENKYLTRNETDFIIKALEENSSLRTEDVVEKEKILDFIEDNRPTDIQTDWERGCAYVCDEIEKLLK